MKKTIILLFACFVATFAAKAQLDATPSVLPDGTIGEKYSYSINTGVSSYTVTITAGALPDGLNISKNANHVVIGGTPTKLGTFKFTVKHYRYGKCSNHRQRLFWHLL